MKSIGKILLLSCLLWAAPAIAEEDITTISEFTVGQLQNNQTLRVSVHFQGCFSSGSMVMEINQRNAVLLESGYQNPGSVYPPYKMTNQEIDALDRHLLWLEKNGTKGGCTTSQAYQMDIIENGQPIKSKNLTHDWCGYYNLTRERPYRDESAPERSDFGHLSYKIRQISEPSAGTAE